MEESLLTGAAGERGRVVLFTAFSADDTAHLVA